MIEGSLNESDENTIKALMDTTQKSLEALERQEQSTDNPALKKSIEIQKEKLQEELARLREQLDN